ncbi:pentatricopeptide repeat-containing protein At3g53700, chloroplastic-like [Cryptomeria japonica]|uniref:pentatricopeptide repeat-containing protein At3g53700, chloroplastic-like n=1 Tax=Cryptomeria japonica TaxID=3369 RepID=UPI0027D9F1A6|nr:pentatricopeptide repeat-containing protein At3g53700, chloroplastic-like [Cryptomeria japonica]
MDMVGKMLEEMAMRNLKPNEVTYTTIIDGLCKAGDLSRAHSLMNKMFDEGLSPDAVTCNCLIDAHCKLGEMDKAMTVGIAPDVVNYNTLIDCFCKENKLDRAFSMLNEMKAKGLVPDIITYNTLLDTLRHRHDLEKTLLLMDQMKKEGCAPSDATVRILDWLVGSDSLMEKNVSSDDTKDGSVIKIVGVQDVVVSSAKNGLLSLTPFVGSSSLVDDIPATQFVFGPLFDPSDSQISAIPASLDVASIPPGGGRSSILESSSLQRTIARVEEG